MRLIVDGKGTEKYVPQVEPNDPFVPSEPTEDVDWREQLEEYERRQAFHERMEASRRKEIFIDTPTDRAFGVVFSGDWHVLSEGFDFPAFKRDAELLIETPNLGVILMGDEADNFTWNPGAFEQLGNPYEQTRLLGSIFRELIDDGKLLARVGGNHTDEWLFKNAGMEFADVVLGLSSVPRLREGGLVHHRIGKQVLTYLARHRTRYNSSLNMQHGNRSAWRREANADVVVSGHTHDLGSAQEYLSKMGVPSEVALIKSGSYKAFDRYGSERGMSRQQTGCPIFIVCPNGDRYAVNNLPKGIRLLNNLNK